MAKITIEELSESLKNYLDGLGLTEAQVQELIDKFEDEKIGDISQLSTQEKGSLVRAINEVNQKANKEVDLSNYQQKTDNNLQTSSKNLVGAINELFQNANNGKELIASAIGEPLDSNDTFSAMSNDINGLLSQFKTNMMKNGITIESGDKFKSLIDKIATMVEEGSGKGVQIASGIASNNFSEVQIDGTHFTCLNISLNFKPTILIVRNHGNYGFYIENFYPGNFSIVTVDNGSDEYRNVSNYEIDKGNNNYSIPIGYTIQKDTTYYWAVGVGEEDTTLRDSLASILQEEGVSVTEEDDMASLIGKVDEEFTKDNNTINNLNSQIANKDNTIEDLNSTITSKNNEITNLNNQVDKLQQELNNSVTIVHGYCNYLSGYMENEYGGQLITIPFETTLDFIPSRVMIKFSNLGCFNSGQTCQNFLLDSNNYETKLNEYSGCDLTIRIESISNSNCIIRCINNSSLPYYRISEYIAFK